MNIHMSELKNPNIAQIPTMYEPHGWTFDTEEVAQVFDTHVQQSVPFYRTFHDMITTFAQYYIEPMTTVMDIGCSTGTLLTQIAKANKKRGVEFTGIDTSQAMIKRANSQKHGLNVKFQNIDVRNYDFGSMSFAYSMLCLQFLPLADRQSVLDNIYNGLEQGGAFVLVEKVKSPNINIHDIYNDVYYDFKRQSGLSDKEILDKNMSLRGTMKPLTLEANIKMLEKAGFNYIEVFMKYNNFAGIIATK